MEMKQMLTKIWLSIYSTEAIAFRKEHGIASYHSQMSILLQQQLPSVDYEFEVHTSPKSTFLEIDVWLGKKSDSKSS
jgi:hypothetical protein